MLTKDILGNWTKNHICGGLPSGEKMNPFKQICRTPTRGYFLCLWLGQGFKYLRLEVWLPLIVIEGG
jgi:hypothetical protein